MPSNSMPSYVPARLRARAIDAVVGDAVPYVVTDEYGRVVHASGPAGELLAARTDRLVGKLFIYRVGAESRAVVARTLAALREGATQRPTIVTLRNFRGEPFRVELEAARALDEDGLYFVLRLRNVPA